MNQIRDAKKICFVGDVVPTKSYIIEAPLEKLILEHDVRFFNLEGAFSKNGNRLFKAGTNILLNRKYFHTFTKCFNVAILSNNHSMDYQAEGLRTSIAICHEQGLGTIGAGMDINEAYLPLDYENCRFIAVAENEFGAADEMRPGIATADNTARIYRLIRQGRNDGKLVIIISHGGTELITIPPPYLRERYRLWVEFGADLVIGSHPHVVQGHEIFNGKHIFYSLGNFAFQADHFSVNERTKWSILLSVNTESGDIEIIPISTDEKGIIGLPVQKDLTAKYKKLCDDITSNTYLSDYDRLASELYLQWYQRLEAKTPQDAALLLHYLRCDAHRHLLQQALARITMENGQRFPTNSSIYEKPVENSESILKKQIEQAKTLKLIVGAGNTAYQGWISTNEYEFDISKDEHWKDLFESHPIDAIIAEHVLEHIDAKNLPVVFEAVRRHLAPNGRFRVAVPDANHPSAYVRELTKPGGLEPGADDHRVFLNIDSMVALASASGMRLEPLEWFDSNGRFHKRQWLDNDGVILRSSKYYKGRFSDPDEYIKLIESTHVTLREQYKNKKITYTSLIVDFRKDDSIPHPDQQELIRLGEEYLSKIQSFSSKFCAPLNKSIFHAAGQTLGLMFKDDMSPERYFLNRIVPLIDAPLVVDVGAHEGKYSAHVKSLNCMAEIHAFEANPNTYEKLRTVADRIGVKAVMAGCSDREGKAILYDYSTGNGSGHASFHKSVFDVFHKQEAASVPTKMITIDNYIENNHIGKVDLLKIDTEGHEWHVIKGAQKSIKSGIIGCIQFEFNALHVQSKTFLRDIYDLLPGFLFYRMLPDGLMPLGSYNAINWELFQLQNIIAITGNHPFRRILEL